MNTDFIDNSAGVNMSDYEVNLKILCKLLIDTKKMKSLKARNTLLKEAEGQVTDLVLSNNRAKHRLLSMDMIRSKASFDLFYHLHHFMVDRKIIDPKTEVLLTNEKLRELDHSKQSLPRPYLAILQAYVKMMVFDALVDDLKQCTYDLSDYYISYFPSLFTASFQDSFDQHHLKTEILATVLSNRIVNQAGSIFFYRVQNLSNASLSSIAYSYLYFEQVTGCHLLRHTILKTDLSLDDQYHLTLVIEDALFRLVIDQLHHGHTLHFDKIGSLKTQFKAFSQASSNSKFIHSWQKKRIPESLLKTLSSLTDIRSFTDILLLKKPLSMSQGLALLSYVDQLYGFDWLNDQLTHLQLNSQWEYHQQELLYQHLRQEKNKLILSFLNDQKTNSSAFSKATFNKYIESHYGPALLNFSQLLGTLKLSKVGLTELSVAIFSLKL